VSQLRHTYPLVLVLLLAAFPAARQATPPPPGVFERAGEVPEARPGVDSEPEAFEFEQSGFHYRVANNGAGRRTKDGAPTRLFNLRLTGGDSIARLYFSEYVNNVLLVCEVGDMESGAGFAARLEQPSMRARWKADFPAFNVGPPVRDGAHLYLTGVGFVAKLDLKTGKFVWKHSRLYGRAGADTFNSFGPPEVSGDEVIFRESGVRDRDARTLHVSRKTGKILRIE